MSSASPYASSAEEIKDLGLKVLASRCFLLMGLAKLQESYQTKVRCEGSLLGGRNVQQIMHMRTSYPLVELIPPREECTHPYILPSYPHIHFLSPPCLRPGCRCCSRG